MPQYCVNTNSQSNGDHEVHRDGCSFLPNPENQHYLGVFPTCGPAKAAARKIYPTADGCAYCCPDCHKR